MLVKDHFKRISWEELFQYDLSPTAPETEEPQRGKSPFMKKQFNSLNTIISNEENVLLTANNYSTKNYQETSRPSIFKKAESTSISDNIKPII